MLRDKAIDRQWASMFIPAKDFLGVSSSVITKAIIDADATSAGLALSNLGGADTTTAIMTALAGTSIKMNGLLVNDTSDVLQTLLVNTKQIDWANPVRFRIHYTSTSVTSADTITWVVQYRLLTADAAMSAASLVALDTPITAQTNGSTTPNLLKITPTGVLAASTIAPTASQHVLLQVSASTITFASSKKPYLLGLEIGYIPHLAYGIDVASRGLAVNNPPW